MQYMRGRGPFLAMGLLGITVAGSWGSAALSPSEMLGEFTRTAHQHGQWLIEGVTEVKDEAAMEKGPNHIRTASIKSVYRRDGDRIDVLAIRPEFAWHSMIDGWCISYQEPPTGELARAGYLGLKGEDFVGKALPSAVAPFEGYLASDLKEVGSIFGAQSGSSLRVVAERSVVEDVPCVLLEGSSPDYGTYQLWLDPSRGYILRKAIVVKSGRNFSGSSRMEEQTHLHPLGSRGVVMKKDTTWTLDLVKADRAGGRWFPVSCRSTAVHRYEDGNAQTITATWHRAKLEVEAASLGKAGAFVPTLREGAILSNQEDPHVPYEWRAGKPVPRVEVNSK